VSRGFVSSAKAHRCLADPAPGITGGWKGIRRHTVGRHLSSQNTVPFFRAASVTGTAQSARAYRGGRSLADLLRRSPFHDPTQVHDGDPITHVPHDPEIMVMNR